MYQIIIDGPSGSGKTSVGRRVADILGILFFDSDILKGAIAVACVSSGVNPTIEEDVKKVIMNNKFNFKRTDSGMDILLNGNNIVPQLRNRLVISASYSLAHLKIVGDFILYLQNELAKTNTIVIEGLNAAKSFPNAQFKFFLNADADVRAKRKLLGLNEQGIYNVTYDQILLDIIESDRSVFVGEASKIEIAKDAVVIDTTFNTIAETADEIAEVVRKNL